MAFFLNTPRKMAPILCIMTGWIRSRSTNLKLKKILLKDLLEGEEIEFVDFLKIDTEGHDFFVLKGLGAWLRPERISTIYTEMGDHREPITQLLKSRGYTPFGKISYNRREVFSAFNLYLKGETPLFSSVSTQWKVTVKKYSGWDRIAL